MNEPYRYACPHDHRTIRTIGNSVHSDCEPAFRCEACRANGDSYHYAEVKDLKTGRMVTP